MPALVTPIAPGKCLLATVLIALAGSNAAAGFLTAPTYPAGPRPDSVAVGDFNGDGVPDLAVGDFNRDGIPDLAVTDLSGVSILLGKGDGTFQDAQGYAAGPGGQVVAGDFNGDGFPDLAFAAEATILLNAADWRGGP